MSLEMLIVSHFLCFVISFFIARYAQQNKVDLTEKEFNSETRGLKLA